MTTRYDQTSALPALRPAPRPAHWLAFLSTATILCVLLWAQAQAKGGRDPAAEAFIEGLGEQAVQILNDETRSQEDKTSAFGQLVMANTDIDAIGYFSLGQYRRQASPEQLEEFLRLFRQYTENFYKARLGQYSGERLVVKGSLVRSAKDVIVLSQLRFSGASEPLAVNWRLRKHKDGHYSIRDLGVGGIWLALEQRSQFTSIIANSNGNVGALLDRLREKVAVGEGLDYAPQSNS